MILGLKADEEQSWGSDNGKVIIKKNIIKFHKDLPHPEESYLFYSNNPFSPKLVIIDNLMRESSSSDAS